MRAFLLLACATPDPSAPATDGDTGSLAAARPSRVDLRVDLREEPPCTTLNAWPGDVRASDGEPLCAQGYDAVGGDLVVDGDLAELACVCVVEGDLVVEGAGEAYALDGFDVLEEVGGTVRVAGNPGLQRLDGLETLRAAGGLELRDNGGLGSIAALQNLSEVRGDVWIGDHQLLDAVDGLPTLATVAGDLRIVRNPRVASIGGLAALREVGGDLELADDDALTDVTPLHTLERVGGDLRVTGNDALPTAAAEAFAAEVDEIGGDVTIEGNGP
ncbi:MAG: hypothetical protein ACOZNI_33495 [Myxococcota bacterium]